MMSRPSRLLFAATFALGWAIASPSIAQPTEGTPAKPAPPPKPMAPKGHPAPPVKAKGPGPRMGEHVRETAPEKGPAAPGSAAHGHGAPHHEHGMHKDKRHDGDRGRPELSETFKKRMAKLKESRSERRQAHRAKLKKRWDEHMGAQGQEQRFHNEFRRHGWRMARLNRIRMLAEDQGKTELVERVDKLIEKENAKHEARLERIKNHPLPAASGAPGPSAAPPAGSAAPPPEAQPAAPASS